MTQRWIFLLIFMCLAVGPAAMADETPTALVQTEPATMRTLAETLTAYGVVQPDPQELTVVSASHGGQVRQLWVNPHQMITAGGKLLELSTDPAATYAYRQAEAQQAYAKGQLARIRGLFTQQLATRDQVAAASKAFRDAESALAAQRRLGNDRASTVLRAPYDGIVVAVHAALGDWVQTGAPLVTVAKENDLQVRLGVEPEEATALKTGMPVLLTSVFDSKVTAQTQLAAIHRVVDPGSRLVDAVVELEGPTAGGFLAGMQVRGTITVGQRNTLAVPRSAVLTDARGSYLFVVRDGAAHRVAVAVGLQTDRYVAVQGDVKAGDPVVTLGNYELTDGMRVREASP